MTCMDIWLLLCMGFVFLALAEYAVILGIRFNQKRALDEKCEKYLKLRCGNIDCWALKIFIGLYILVVGAYFYCIYSNV